MLWEDRRRTGNLHHTRQREAGKEERFDRLCGSTSLKPDARYEKVNKNKKSCLPSLLNPHDLRKRWTCRFHLPTTPTHTHTRYMGKLRLGKMSNWSQVAHWVKTQARASSHLPAATALHCDMELKTALKGSGSVCRTSLRALSKGLQFLK